MLLLFLAALPPIVLATSDAVRSVSQDRLLALQTLGASRFQVSATACSRPCCRRS